MRFYTRFLWLIVLCSLVSGVVQAQPGRDNFGKSRIQYKHFDWKVYSTPNFNLYFYQGGDQIARNAAEYAEKELKRVTSLIGYYPYSKITFILYNSATDLRQSNIGLNSDQFQTGGETLFLKNKIEVAFEGTQTEFKRSMSYQLTELLLSDMMYGGSLKEALQSSYLLRLPDWFISGVAAYTAEGWSVEMDNYVRDMILQNPNQKPEMLLKHNQNQTGHAIWNYIAERYGYTAIQNILNLTRITRDVEIGITSSLNIPYKRFLQDWNRYYLQVNTRQDNPLASLPDDKKLFQKNKKDLVYTQPVLNPDGSMLAYAENDNGKFKIYVQEVKSGRNRIVWTSGYKTLEQKIDYKLPVLAWRSNTQLGFVEARRGEMALRQIDARRRLSRLPLYDALTTPFAVLSQFSQVRDMSYSPDGKSLVVSAVKNGQSDIYLLSATGRLQQQLTNDLFDDIQPVFMKGSNDIAFSSNRWQDTTGTNEAPTFTGMVNNYDIFLLQRSGREVELKQLTRSISSELMPKTTEDGNLVYLGEQSGVRSLYLYNIATGATTPLTGFLQDVKEYDYQSRNNTLAFTASSGARDFVYLFPAYTAPALAELPKTARQIILETRARNAAAAAAVANQKLLDASSQVAKPKRPEGEVNIENYQFESDKAATARKAESTTVVKRPGAPQGLQLTGPTPYDLRFSVHEIVTSVYADPLLGFGIVAGINMSDLFEDHHIRGSAFLKTDFQTSRFFAEYTNLKNRYDYGARFSRDIIVAQDREASGTVLRFAKHEFAPQFIYPLTYSTSLHIRPQYVNTRFTYVNEFTAPDSVNHFGGGNIELVYDNSIATGVNMLQGTRMKAGLLSLKSINDNAASFNKFYVDIRHYQKLHKQIVLATRLSYGAFFGNAPKSFLIGGMDNWLFASEDEESERNSVPIGAPADLFYLQYVTPLRGFNFNTRTGDKYVIGNAELRIPIVQYLYDGQIPSGFFRNLQLTAFADAGSAYSGSNPFTGNNSINTRTVGGGSDPFEVTVINYRSPFLVGYGFGARSALFGVYGKLDVAWSEDDFTRNGPKFYVTLGYDF
ncbi:PD40 domain-containing protein [Pontibacter beigongshangensis]|uniref:PD40 domain-containing protein n=1 Tax=Pontibacter beigongshangensis TaxID=2574733 RepID=UPI00164F778B|nr:PD40 domain-containing protein [Pontibacter beigongshangensis]